MDRNRVVLGLVLAMVILAAVKLPAIPVETEAGQVINIEGYDEEFHNTEPQTSQRAEQTSTPTESNEAPGAEVVAMEAPQTYDIPLAHEIRDVAVERSEDATEIRTDATIENLDDETGEFGVIFTYEDDGTVIQRERAEPRRVEPGNVATFQSRISRPDDTAGLTVTVSVVPEMKQVQQTSEPNTAPENVTLSVHEVAINYDVVDLNAGLSSEGRGELFTTVDIRNTDSIAGEFIIEFSYQLSDQRESDTVRRSIEPGETAAVTSSISVDEQASTSEIDVNIEPPTKIVTTQGDGEIESTVETETVTTTFDQQNRLTLLEYVLRLFK